MLCCRPSFETLNSSMLVWRFFLLLQLLPACLSCTNNLSTLKLGLGGELVPAHRATGLSYTIHCKKQKRHGTGCISHFFSCVCTVEPFCVPELDDFQLSCDCSPGFFCLRLISKHRQDFCEPLLLSHLLLKHYSCRSTLSVYFPVLLTKFQFQKTSTFPKRKKKPFNL